MRIRAALNFAIAMAIALVAVRLGLVIHSTIETNRLDSAQVSIDQITENAINLVIFGQDFALNANERASQQWRAVHREIMSEMAALQTQTQTVIPAADVLALREDVGNLNKLFNSLNEAVNAKARPVNPAQVRMLSDQLVSQSGELSTAARTMGVLVSDAQRAQRDAERRNSVAFPALFLCLIFCIAALVLRGVLRPLKSLELASVAIESGDLSARTAYQSSTEIGDLSKRFNTMAGGLESRTQALETAQIDLLRIMDAMPPMIGYWDQDLICRFANHAYKTWFGVDPGSMPGTSMQALLGPVLMEKNRAYVEGALAGVEQTFERELPDPAGGPSRHSLARYLPDLRGGKVRGFYVLVFDVSDLKNSQQQLEITHRELQLRTSQAEQASRAKSAFLANMSHEIRTPLNAVLGMHRMLQDTNLKPGQSDLLGKANQAGQTLMDIINNVLDLAKIEAGEMSANAQPFQPRRLFEELVSVHGVVAHNKGLKLTLDTAEDLPLWIVGDRFFLRQVLSNLLGNAIKFTATGAVKLSARVRRDGSEPWLELVVQDSGVGISQEAIGRLFTPFVQADESTTRQFGGTGLGLSIVRNLAQMMGGDAQVSSTPGVGSEFSITLPLVEADEHLVAEATRASRPIEVALMCANENLCQDMRQRLTALGWSCFRPMAAETGEPDVLLMDAAMGKEGTVRLREMVDASNAQGHDLPTILLGDAQELVAMESLALPPHRLVQKPADMSSIFNAVVEVLALGKDSQDRLIGSTRAIEGGIHWLQGARILVVDDNEINLEIAVALLRQQGAICHTCVNGQEAADWLLVHPDEVDAVLMDVQMPVLDGLEATRLIKSHAALKSLPVIALTAGALDSERLRAKAAGMDDFLTKPLEPVDVVKLLRNKIGSYRGRAPQVGLTQPDEGAIFLDKTKSHAWPDIPGINKELAMIYLSNSPGLFKKLLALLQKNYSAWGATWLELAHQKGVGINADLCASLHKLRGSAGMLGAAELAAVAGQAESAILGGSALPLEAVQQVARVLDELLAHLHDQPGRRESSGPVMDVPGALTSSGRKKLDTLAGMLAGYDLDAIDLGLALRQELVSLLGQEDAEGFLQKMDELDFSAAHALLISRQRIA